MPTKDEIPELPSTRKSDITDVIAILAARFSLDVDASIRQCEKESSFRTDVRNPVSDAYGLFQLEAPTAFQMGVDRHDPASNIYGGLKYMRWLKQVYKFTDRQAYAGYDWGGGNVHKLISEHPDDWESRLPTETREYVTFICGEAGG